MRNKSAKLYAISVVILCVLGFCIHDADAWQSDNGNGTFTNPVLYADYPDPDIIRVGSDFYMVSTTFVDSPGINVLHSQDLVNWELISHAASSVDGGNSYNMIGGTVYRGGFWASSIRYHNGTFYIAVQPNFANGRIYYATNPAGPWSYYQLDRSIYDPGLFFDTDGTGYIICGHGPQSIMTLNSTYSAVVSQVADLINSGGEGSHVVKRGSYYYLFNANPGIWPFQLRCSRATNILGPWETGHICLTATTGGHQGAIVDIDDSDHWYGFVHQDSGAVGRMPRIGPVFWENNWPVFGTTTSRDQIASTYTKPILGKPIIQPATSDDFSASTLGLQWQWNHNPDNTRWSLTERTGYLRLRPTQASSFWTARNTLTQKGQGPQSNGVVKFDISNLQNGDIAGMGTLGEVNGYIYVTADAGGNKTLGMVMDHRSVGIFFRASNVPFTGATLYLRTDLNFSTNQGNCSYSTDGTTWKSLGGYFPLEFDISTGTFQGEKYAIFCYNPNTASSAGYVDVDLFAFGATSNSVSTQRGRPVLNAAKTTFIGDNGHLLRGPYESTEWTTAAPQSSVALIKDIGFNTVHLYAESFDPDYPAAGSTAPGYAVAEVDKFVQMTRDLGLYLIITIGNGAYNGSYNKDWIVAFWNFYAPRYANETHVLYEIQNEPVAWGPSYLTATTPAGAIDMEVAAYNTIRTYAPNTPVLLFSYAVFGGFDGTSAALTDIRAFNTTVFGNANAVWTNEAVGFHGYAGWSGTSQAVAGLLAAGYPCFMTEFGADEWSGSGGFDVELASELERMKVSWASFQYIPPSGVSDDVTVPAHYKDRVDRAGMSWASDYGTWPLPRGPYGNGGLPRATTSTFTNNFLTGTLRIQAEDFDTGGQGIAYNDTDTANQGGQYRTGEGVDIQTTTDTGGGYNVGWTANGEWLEYSIFVPEPGFFNLSLRVASAATGCAAKVICWNLDKTGTWTVPNTGGVQTWTTITKQVFLEFGRQKLRLEIPTGGFNINWIELSPYSTAPIANGTYKLANQNSGMVIENNTTTHKIVQNTYSGTNIQLWNILHRGAGQYSVQSVQDNYYWNTFNETMTWWGGDNPGKGQRFILRSSGDGYYRMMPVDSGKSYEVQNASQAASAAIVQNEYLGLVNQNWGILASSAPAFPTGLIATASSSTQINLTWNAVPGAISYNVKRSTTSGGSYTTIATGVTATSYSDAGLTAGIRYYYVVSAVIGGVESLNSAQASASVMRAYLKFDETSGTTAVDAAGNGWTGTLVNGPLWSTSGKFNNAVDLDGTNDYVSLPSGVVNGLTTCTVSAWVYLDAVSSWARMFDFGTGTSNYMFLAPSNGSVIRFAIRTASVGEQQISGTAALSSSAWIHVALVLNGSTGILYVNGAEVGRNSSMTLTPSSLGATTQNYIGKSQFSSDAYLNGRVDDFRIYPDALSAAEVASLASATVSNSAPVFTADPINNRGAIERSAYSGTSLATYANDADGLNTVTFRKVSGPAWLTVASNGTLSGIPLNANVGANAFTVQVTDNGGLSDKATMNITVANIYSGVEGLNDLLGLASQWLASGCTDTPACDGADLDGDADVDLADFSELANYWLFPEGIQLYFKLDETSGTTAADDSLYGRSGVLINNPAWSTEGKSLGALSFDGTNDYVTVAYTSALNPVDFTVAFWARVDGNLNTFRTPICSRDVTGGVLSGYNIYASNTNTWDFWTGTGTAFEGLTGPSVSNGQWTHVAISFQAASGPDAGGVYTGTKTLYINGVSAVGTTTGRYVPNSREPFTLGRINHSQLWYFNGLLDDVRIYNRALTASEIAALAQ
jgi:endoglucanase